MWEGVQLLDANDGDILDFVLLAVSEQIIVDFATAGDEASYFFRIQLIRL